MIINFSKKNVNIFDAETDETIQSSFVDDINYQGLKNIDIKKMLLDIFTENSVDIISYLQIFYKKKKEQIETLDFNKLECINFIVDDIKDINEVLSFLEARKEKCQIDLSSFSLKEIFDNLDDKYYDSDIYVFYSINNKSIKISKLLEVYKYIGDRVNEIKNYDLSPLEQLLYAYDITKRRIYKREKENESCFKSRDLSEIVFNDEIVCVGFSNLLNAIVKELDMNSEAVICHYNDRDVNHQISLVALKDEKYNFDGTLLLDPTSDSVKKGYYFFGKSFKKFVNGDCKIFKNYNLGDTPDNNICYADFFDELKKDELIYYFGEKENCDFERRLYNLQSFVEKDKSSEQIHYQVQNYDNYLKLVDKYDQEIPRKTFARILYKLLKIKDDINFNLKEYLNLYQTRYPFDQEFLKFYQNSELLKNEQLYEEEGKVISKIVSYNRLLNVLINGDEELDECYKVNRKSK